MARNLQREAQASGCTRCRAKCGFPCRGYYVLRYSVCGPKSEVEERQDYGRELVWCRACFEADKPVPITMDTERVELATAPKQEECVKCGRFVNFRGLHGVFGSSFIIDGSTIEERTLGVLCGDCTKSGWIELL